MLKAIHDTYLLEASRGVRLAVAGSGHPAACVSDLRVDARDTSSREDRAEATGAGMASLETDPVGVLALCVDLVTTYNPERVSLVCTSVCDAAQVTPATHFEEFCAKVR